MLNDLAIRKTIRDAKAAGKPLKRFDERGLFLLASPSGTALWRFKYVFGGLEKLISFGSYADVPLKRAREKRDAARKLVADGIDPSAVRKAEKVAQADSVKALTEEYLEKQAAKVSAGTLRRDRRRMEKYIFPTLGNKPIAQVTAPELLAALRRIETQGFPETASRTLEVCGRVWRFAVATSRAPHNIAADLKGALAPAAATSYAALTDPKAVGALLRAIDGYVGQPSTAYALKLAPLVFVRPGELRAAEWAEFDLDSPEPLWRIPSERMKMKREHLVPLATQAVAILRELQTINHGRLLFPGLRSAARPISDNTVNAGLRRMGYDGDEQVGHGFRTIASTLLNELGWHPDLIELQLAHAPQGVRAIYNRSQRLEERRKMMQAWADHLDKLRATGNNVVPIRSQSAAA